MVFPKPFYHFFRSHPLKKPTQPLYPQFCGQALNQTNQSSPKPGPGEKWVKKQRSLRLQYNQQQMMTQNSKLAARNESCQAIKLRALVSGRNEQWGRLKLGNQPPKIANFKNTAESRECLSKPDLVKRKNKSNDHQKRRNFFEDSFAESKARKVPDSHVLLPSFFYNKPSTLQKNQSEPSPPCNQEPRTEKDKKTNRNPEKSREEAEIQFKKKASLGESVYDQLKTTTSTNASCTSMSKAIQKIKTMNVGEQRVGTPSFLWNHKISKKELRIYDFELIRYIQQGQFGEVHLARHLATNFLCALKKIPKRIFGGDTSYLIREIKIQSYLQHPNIVRLYSFFHDEDSIYLMMEYCSGGNLFSNLKKHIRLPEYKVKKYLKQVCRAVSFMHAHDIIHRDIKPENILVHQDMVKICDFGWSVNSPSLRSTHCGTPLYSSPEIVLKKQYDSKVDVWNIGVLTYELLYGRAPFEIRCEDDLIKIVEEDVFFSKNYPVSSTAKDFILKCLKKDPKQRETMAKLLDHLFFQQ